MQINQINQTNFCSKYKFISSDKYHDLINHGDVIEVGNYGSALGLAGKDQKIYTTGIGTCTAYGLGISENSEFAGVWHYNKTPHEMSYMLPCFPKKMLKGFMIGGDIYKGMSDFYEETRKKYEENGIAATIFWGQKCGFSNICYDFNEDTVYINAVERGLSDVDSVKSLKYAFKTIEIADGDEVYIDDEKINPLDIIA